MKKPILVVKNLDVEIEGKQILSRISVSIFPGEVHAIMGPNGSGKSTFVYTLMGHPYYSIKNPHIAKATRAKQKSKVKSLIRLNNEDITFFSSEDRAKKGLFLALQSPIAVPGVTVLQLVRAALQERSKSLRSDNGRQKFFHNPLLAGRQAVDGMSLAEFTKKVKDTAQTLSISPDLLTRGIHDGFSGGERKKIELLEALILGPKVAMFDEVDTGLDVDSLRIVAAGIEKLRKHGTAILLITHYQRLLRYIEPDVIHILVKGKIVATGDKSLAEKIEKEGYTPYETNTIIS